MRIPIFLIPSIRSAPCCPAAGLPLLLGLTFVLMPAQAQRTQPEVAIHDSELTRALEDTPAGSATPHGPGTSGFEWWPTDWHYFVMPESLQEALRSDGTAFTVVRDADISAGLLLANGAPRFPIVISLASEAIRDDEIAAFTNYVAAGGFLLVGSSAFTRQTNGVSRGDFAFANEMGVHMAAPTLTNWAYNSTFTKQSNNRLVEHIPPGELIWRMPMYAEETSWGISPAHPFLAPHDLWRVRAGDATVLAWGDQTPYLLIKPYGKGCFIYDAAAQPLIGHGGFAPGMYAYVIFRRAIEWAFESARLPVPKLSPWPFPYDAAFVVRHDLENFQHEIASIEDSARVEFTNGVKGDYYFCTGTLRIDMGSSYDTNAVVASLRRAITSYGATIGPHNGGLRNPNNPALTNLDYDFWHWGTDEALDVTPPGYPDGKTYALSSLSNAFSAIESWLPGLMTASLRTWVAPSFNATRENSYDIQSQLGVKIAGEQKLTPFPHWTLSTQTSGKRHPILSQPVSDWFVGGLVAQSLEPWHPPGVHTSTSMHSAVDFYYHLGALINLYSHTLSTGEGDAGQLVPDYITYCMDTNLHPHLWPANSVGIYQWWLQRSSVQVVVAYSGHADQAAAAITVSGARHPDTTVELQLPGPGGVRNLQVSMNGNPAAAGAYRLGNGFVKLRVGDTVTNAQVAYTLPPAARGDYFICAQGAPLFIGSPGVLTNDAPGAGGGTLTAATVNAPGNGTVDLQSNGAFVYAPASGFTGLDTFGYRAGDGSESSDPTTVFVQTTEPGILFADNFDSPAMAGSLVPWVAAQGTWENDNGRLTGAGTANSYGNVSLALQSWTDYAFQARIRFSAANALGGGIGGRVNPATGAHYGAWLYPEGSAGGSAVLKLIKFEGWSSWSGTPMQSVPLPGLGTNWHTLGMVFNGSDIKVFFDGVQQLDVIDNNYDSVPAHTSGGISVDMYADNQLFTLEADDVRVSTLDTPPVITTQPASQTASLGDTVSFAVEVQNSSVSGYQWYKNGINRLVDGGNVSGATTSRLTLTGVANSDVGDYSVVIQNGAASVTSARARLGIADPPVIDTQPQSRTNTAGTDAKFSVEATGSGLTYQWRFNGAGIAGATSSIYTRQNVQAADAGSYSVVVSNGAGAVLSSAATLTVVQPQPPAIETQPKDQTVIAGQSVTFSVSATGTAPLRYRWMFNGSPIAGATGSSYVIPSARPADAGKYAVVVLNDYGKAVSRVATLTVNYSLTVSGTAGGSVLILPSQESYAPGSVVVLTATPAVGYVFTGWSGSASGILNPLIVTMNDNKVITANFKPLLGGVLNLR